MHPAALTARFGPAGLAIAGVGLAVAVAAGVVAVPDMAGSISGATRSLGGWIYLAVVVLVFFETMALVGFVIHGELALLVPGPRPSAVTRLCPSSSASRGERRSRATS